MAGTELAPVAGRARIEVLDVLRGLAILGIFYMNIPFMAVSVPRVLFDPTLVGWTPADAHAWTAVQVLLEGTQRCVLQFLFGAGLMVLTTRIADPDGPVAVADLYFRRTLWLLAFGVFDVFAMLWPGDILHVYALAALFLFPFRRLGPRTLVAIGSLLALFQLVTGGVHYAARADLLDRHRAVEATVAAHRPLTAADRATLGQWGEWKSHKAMPPAIRAIERIEPAAHRGGFVPYATFLWGGYLGFIYPSLLGAVAEAFCAMCIGIALWKWGVIQGRRSRRFYLGLAVAAYAVAVPLRWIAAEDMVARALIPRLGWATGEGARLVMGLGHVCLVNLLMLTGPGRALLAPFRAAGRTAFSIYFLETAIGVWFLFAPWGPGLWGRLGWAGMTGAATAVIVLIVPVANVWMRFFAIGPLEWLWRSLAYGRPQPFRRAGTAGDAVGGLSTPEADAAMPLAA
ncbi:DUF418 domain-containing protein [Sphingomonas bacterium]|uniref:DUF418 domain-containing protein n=1 Tax=Sphingomonas bacterium TaxID=1895847 RepID=UPI001576D7A7|nr:DUF418 domain-containing protein [Sphingomonas bacterium]